MAKLPDDAERRQLGRFTLSAVYWVISPCSDQGSNGSSLAGLQQASPFLQTAKEPYRLLAPMLCPLAPPPPAWLAERT